MNSITSCKFNGIPLIDGNISKKICEFNKLFENKNSNDLNIVAINGLYGYRTGITGWVLNLCSFYLSRNSNPKLIQNFLNYVFKEESKILSNDFEIISYYLSLVSRSIPILNYGNWDPKSFLLNNKESNMYMVKNLSLPKIYDLNSLYLLSPLLDCGCAIYSNKTPEYTGFEKWKLWNNIEFKDKKFNKGITWAFYKNNNSGITVIALNLHSSDSSLLYNMQIQQIIKLKKHLEEKFSHDLSNYETYITGDFTNELKISVDSLLGENLEIIENSLNNHLILYSNNSKKHNSVERISIFEDEVIKVNFSKNVDVKINVDNVPVDIVPVDIVPVDIVPVDNDISVDNVLSNINQETKISRHDIIVDYFEKKADKDSTPKGEWVLL